MPTLALLRRAHARRAPPTSWPEMRISPALARSRPATARSRVVLPQPDGPISTPMSPARRPNETSSTAARGRPGYWTRSLVSSTSMGAIVDAYNSHLLSTAIAPGPPWPCAGCKTCLCCCWRPCWCCRCWPCWLPGCNGTRQRARSWARWRRTVLPGYVWTSLGLCLAVGLGVGAGRRRTAAAVTLFDFPGRRTFEWALLLPLAMPAYVVAYAYTDFLQFSGPLQSWLRGRFGLQGRVLPRSAQPAAARCWSSSSRSTPMSTCWRARRWPSGPAQLMEAARLLGAPLAAASAAWPCRWRARPSPPASRSR